MILIVLLYAMWAASIVASKMILAYTKPWFLVGVRMTISGLLLLGYQYFRDHARFKYRRKDLWLYAQYTILGFVLPYNLRFWALESVSASKAMFLFSLAPFFSVIYSYLIFKDKVSRTQWVGLLLGSTGLIPILMTTSSVEEATMKFGFISLPELSLIFAVASTSYSWMVVRHLITRRNYSPMMLNGICMFAAGVISFVFSLVLEGNLPVSQALPFIGYLTFIIVISNIICHNLYGYLLHKYTTNFLSFAGFLSPIFGCLYEWILFNETITWHYYVSGIVIFSGLYLFYQDELKQEQLIESEY